MTTTTPTGIDKAVEQAGSQTALAEMLGVTQQAVAKWQARGWAPMKRAKQIAGAFPIPLVELVDPELKELAK